MPPALMPMHEWALAEGVVATVEKHARENGLTSVSEVVVVLGELQQVDEEVLSFALENLRTPMLRETRFTFKRLKARLKCRRCGEEWDFSAEGMEEDVSEAIHFLPEMAHVYLKCPKCGSPDFEFSQGRGVWIESIRGAKDE